MLLCTLFFYLMKLSSALYNISDDVLFNMNWPGTLSDANSYSHSVIIKSADETQYRCSFPSEIRDRYSTPDSDKYSGPDEKELLQPLFLQTACSYKIESYWTYELCHGQHLRQFHQEQQQNSQNVQILQEYILGRFIPEDFEKNLKESKPNKIPTVDIEGKGYPYFQVNFTNGDNCDLTGQPRKANILYVCQSEGRGEIYDLSEVESCQYRIIVITKLLCQNPAYKVHRSHINNIACVPIGENSVTKPSQMVQLEEEAMNKNKKSSLSGLFGEKLDLSGHSIEVEAEQHGDSIVYRVRQTNPPANTESKNPPPNNLGSTKTTRGPPQKSNLKERNELLKSFISGSYCVVGGSGWWKHEVCFMKSVIQFHDSSATERTVINLGKWNADTHKNWMKLHPSKRAYEPAEDREHFWQYYSEGDHCENTKKNREVAIKIKCLQDESISVTIMFQEPQTCQYVITLESAIFCPLVKGTDAIGLSLPAIEE